MTHASSVLPNLDHFDCEGDPTSVGTRWEKWKRAFEIYLLAANVDTPVQKHINEIFIIFRSSLYSERNNILYADFTALKQREVIK
ncbi:hypothetical protein B5X24_HaOG215728 [Helicoverpa armigera]|nr:hypothetical protein B5X24_HaOG215728 [Helicoverpa armigera]